jgi:hypothetical protein
VHKRATVFNYRVVDPYVFVHLRWIEDAPVGVFKEAMANHWLEMVKTFALFDHLMMSAGARAGGTTGAEYSC